MCFPNQLHPNANSDYQVAISRIGNVARNRKMALARAFIKAYKACNRKDFSSLLPCTPLNSNNSKLYYAEVRMGVINPARGYAVACTYRDLVSGQYCYDMLAIDVSASAWIVGGQVAPTDRAAAIAP